MEKLKQSNKTYNVRNNELQRTIAKKDQELAQTSNRLERLQSTLAEVEQKAAARISSVSSGQSTVISHLEKEVARLRALDFEVGTLRQQDGQARQMITQLTSEIQHLQSEQSSLLQATHLRGQDKEEIQQQLQQALAERMQVITERDQLSSQLSEARRNYDSLQMIADANSQELWKVLQDRQEQITLKKPVNSPINGVTQKNERDVDRARQQRQGQRPSPSPNSNPFGRDGFR
jgi:chromosome segregation ATPase